MSQTLSERTYGTTMKILVGISGSIGVVGVHSYLISLLLEREVEEVRAIMTPTAARFVNPRALEAFIHRPIYVDPWTDPVTVFSPPDLVKEIDLYLIAPASATTLSRCAQGSAETLVAHCYLCHAGPVAFAPAMSAEMWEHPAVRKNLEWLESNGACILPAGIGFSATAGKMTKTSMCPYNDMWSRLKEFLEISRNRATPKGASS